MSAPLPRVGIHRAGTHRSGEKHTITNPWQDVQERIGQGHFVPSPSYHLPPSFVYLQFTVFWEQDYDVELQTMPLKTNWGITYFQGRCDLFYATFHSWLLLNIWWGGGGGGTNEAEGSSDDPTQRSAWPWLEESDPAGWDLCCYRRSMSPSLTDRTACPSLELRASGKPSCYCWWSRYWMDTKHRHELYHQSKELNRGPPELVQHFRL